MESCIKPEEEQWIEMLIGLRNEQIATFKTEMSKLREEAKRKKSPHIREYSQLRKARHLELQDARATIESRFKLKDRKLTHVQSVTETYFAAAISKTLSAALVEEFDCVLHENPEYLKFYEEMVHLVCRKRKDATQFGPIVVINRKDAVYLAERTSAFVRENKEKMKKELLAEMYAIELDVHDKYHEKTKVLLGKCREAKREHRKERKWLFKKTAASLIDNLMSIPLSEAQEVPEVQKKVYRALYDVETSSRTDVVFDHSEEGKVRETLERLVRAETINELQTIKMLYLLRANYIQGEKPAGLPEAKQEPTNNAQRRLEVILQVVGEEPLAQHILSANPELTSVGAENFEAYVSALKETKRKLHAAGRSRLINLQPGQFASLESLRHVNAAVDQEDELDSIYRTLERSGYDPEVINAVILAFKPTTKGFTGNSNPIAKKSILNNVRPLIPRKLELVDEYLHLLVSEGVVQQVGKSKEGPYNLNPHINEKNIPDDTLRSLLRYRMPRNGGRQS